MDHSGGGGGVGPSSFCSRAEGQSFAETDAVSTGADGAPIIMDHRVTSQDQPQRDVS